MDCLTTHQYTAISKHSLMRGTPVNIEAWLMSLQVVSHANHFQQREETGGNPIKGINGRIQLRPSIWLDHDSSTWRTYQTSLLTNMCEPFTENWPKAGMMRDGIVYRLNSAEQTIKDFGGGLWPTPSVCGNYNRKGASKTSGDGLATAVKKWQTPQTLDTIVRKKMRPSRKATNRKTEYLSEEIGGALNPTWVEWLMAFPRGWTDLKPLETPKFLLWLQRLGKS